MIRIYLLPLFLCLTGCIMDSMYGHLPNRVRMEPGIHNLEGLNSPYDDFNAVAPPPPFKMDACIVFASNAQSQGKRFSLDVGRLRLTQEPYSASRQGRPPAPIIQAERHGAFSGIPALPGNMRGPTALVSGDSTALFRYKESSPPFMDREVTLTKAPLPWSSAGRLPATGVWMFDADHQGRRNLYFKDASGRARPFFGNFAQADDAYATYDFAHHELYFSSNRSGRWQIYRYKNTKPNLSFSAWLGNAKLAPAVERADELNGPGNTMAPFISGDMLFFASDRPGGRGGFDIYVSRRLGQGWGTPRNLQDVLPQNVRMNTASNEFRPSILALQIENRRELRVLLFSSDRPGGQGGYDLYLTALPEEP